MNIDRVTWIKNESILTNRGYIWNRMLPLVKEHLLLGHGPDTVAMLFEQNDSLNKLALYNRQN